MPSEDLSVGGYVCRIRFAGNLPGRHRGDILPTFWRHDSKPFRCLGLADKLAIMFEHHLRTVASFEAHLVDVLDLRQAVGNEGMPQAVVFPFYFGSRAEVLKALLVR